MELSDHSRPHLAVDLVLLAVTPEPEPRLGVVVQRRDDGTAVLPGRFVRERQTVGQTVAALLEEKLRLRPRRGLALDLVGVYDAPDRDARGWVVSTALTASLDGDVVAQLDPERAEILPVRGSAARGRQVTPEPLAFDHDDMVTTAVRRLRRRYERSPDPTRFLRGSFTLKDLRLVHEAVLDAPLKRDTFNRRMRELLEPATDRDGQPVFTSEGVGRPAQRFVRPRRLTDPDGQHFPLPRA